MQARLCGVPSLSGTLELRYELDLVRIAMTQSRHSIGLVARTLGEALEAVSCRRVRDAIVREALNGAGLERVPERGPEVLAFAEGPLQASLRNQLGDDIAAEVIAQVTPVLSLVARRASVPPVPRTRAPSSPRDEIDHSGVFRTPRPSSSSPVRMLVASHDALLFVELTEELGPRATLEKVDGLLDLIDRLEESEAPSMIVLDVANPTLQLASLITIAPDLRAHTVIVWNATADVQSELFAAAVEGTCEWSLHSGANLRELVDACSKHAEPSFAARRTM